jgi:hypothetical protein
LAQQFGAVPPVVHVADSPRVQAAARHVPLWQVRPSQQSVLVVHVPAVGWQQRPVWHSLAPQHPALVVHAPPVLLQQTVALPTAAQLRPPAQHATAPAMHGAASASEHVGARHVPLWQVNPVQQSALVEHVCALMRHTHRPEVQSI